MPTGSFINNITVAGLNIRSTKTKTATGEIGVEKTLAAAEAGTLTTRTSNTAGTLTMTNTSHGIATAATIDIYWTNGLSYKATVGIVAGTTVPFSLASGDILPAATTAIVANVVTIVDIDFDGDLGELFVVFGTVRGHVTWLDSGGLVLNAQEIPAGTAWDWLNEGQANPLTGNPVASAQISNGDSTVTNDMKIGVLYAA